MKIDNTIQTGATANASAVRGRSAGKSVAGASPTDDVRLSELATQIKPSGDETPIDIARVAEIKQAIAEGRFTINAAAIADRLISSAKELVGAQRQA